MVDESHQEKLARAAAALAQAEGLAAARADPGPSPGRRGEPRRRSVTTPPARGRGRVPPPEDPATAVPDADPAAVARAIVLRQLSVAPRSRAQLERKLRQRGCDDEVAAQVLDRMTEVGLVDDTAFAELLVESKHGGKGLARRGLAHELRQHGIDRAVADRALGGIGTEEERTAAERLVAKKLRTMAGLAPDVQARRLAGLLARKGYSGDIAWPVIRDAVNGAPEHQRD